MIICFDVIVVLRGGLAYGGIQEYQQIKHLSKQKSRAGDQSIMTGRQRASTSSTKSYSLFCGREGRD